MPWIIQEGHDDCADGQWAVVMEDDVEQLAPGGCHDSEDDAQAQADELNLAEAEDSDEGAAGASFVALISAESDQRVGGGSHGDARVFPEGAFGWRDLPLTIHTLLHVPSWGHDGAQVSGHMAAIKRVRADDPQLVAMFGVLPDHVDVAVVARGKFDSGEMGAETARMIDEQTLSGISVDPGGHISVEETCIETEVDPDWGEFCVQVEARFTEYQIAGFTVLDTPAIESTAIRVATDDDLAAFDALDDLGPGFEPDALVASAGAVGLPPSRYFERPEALSETGFRRLHVSEPDENGWRHVFGYVAPAEGSGICHIGYPGECKEAPPSASGYAHFRTGYQLTAPDGKEYATGVLTMGVAHASTERGVTAAQAMAHYSDASLRKAFVNCGDDEHGWWVSGVCCRDISDADVDGLRGGTLSGDWRGIGGHAEGIAALVVNTPGFAPPMHESLVADGRLVAAVGLGQVGDHCGCGGDCHSKVQARLESFEKRLSRQEQLNSEREVQALSASVARSEDDERRSIELLEARLAR